MQVEIVNNRRLARSHFLPSKSAAPGPGLLFVHGLGSGQTGYAPRAERAAVALGVVSLTFNLSGHGRSDGDRNNLAPCRIEWYLNTCRSARHQVVEGASHALTTENWRQTFLTEIVSSMDCRQTPWNSVPQTARQLATLYHPTDDH